MKVAVGDLSPFVVAFGRCALGGAVLLTIAYATGALRGLRAHLPALLVFALLEFAAPFALIAAGTDLIPSSLTGVLMAAGPLCIAALALLFDASERVSGARLLGLVLGLAGVVSLLGLEALDGRRLLGATLVLLGCLSFAAGALFVKTRLRGVPSLAAAACGLAGGAVLLLAPAGFAAPVSAPSAEALGALIVLGLAHGALNWFLFVVLIRRAGAGQATLTAYLAPGVAVVLGVAVLGEHPGIGFAAGLPLILLGSWLGAQVAATSVSGPISATERHPASPIVRSKSA